MVDWQICQQLPKITMGYQRLEFSKRHLRNGKTATYTGKASYCTFPNLIATVGLASLLLGQAAHAAPVNWQGGGGNDFWDNSANWNPGTPGGSDAVTNSTGQTIDVENGGTFDTFVTNGELDLTGGTFVGGQSNSTIQVNGLLNVNGGHLQGVEVLAPTGNQSIVFANNGSNDLIGDTFDAGTTLDFSTNSGAFSAIEGNTSFNGTTIMAAGSSINIYAGNAGASLNNGGLLEGAGLIYQQYGGTMTNSGTVDANLSGQTLTLQPLTLANTGTLEATNGGTLLIDANTTDSGTLSAQGTGSELSLNNMTLTANSDTLSATNGGTLLLNGSTVTGTVNITNGSLSFVNNGSNSLTNLTVNGNLDFASQANAYTQVQGSTVFKGTTSMANGSNINIFAGSAAAQLTNAGTIQGAGTIYQQYGGTMSNSGTVDANVNGQTLTVQPFSLANSGTLEATNGGTLLLSSNTTGIGKFIADGSGSQLQFNGITVSTIGTDTLSATNGGTLLMNGSTINGAVDITNGSLSFVNNGSNQLNNATVTGNLDLVSQNAAFFYVQGTTTLNGTTSMANGSSINVFAGSAAAQLTNAGTIQGAGTIYQQYGGTMSNSGTVDANLSTQTLSLSPVLLTNTNTLEATSGGILALNYNVSDSGTISADGAGSQVQLNGMTLTSNSDKLSATNGGTLLDNGSTITGTLDITNGSLAFVNNGSNQLYNANVTGNLDLVSQNAAFFYVQGTTTLNGTTSMATGSSINVFAGGGTSQLTNAGTIQGAGTIYQQYGGNLVNSGTLNANVSGQTLLVSAGFSNTGNMNASNGGTLTINNAGVVGGNVNATSGSTVNLPNGIAQTGGVSTVDGTLNSSSGNFALSGGTLKGTGSLNLSVAQTGGTFNPGSDPSSMNIAGNYSITGGTYQLDIASPTSFDMLNVSGSADISGGTLSLDFLNGYRPTTGNMYQFLLANSYIGNNAFSSYNSNIAGLGFSYNNGQVTIGNVPPPAVPEASSVLSMLSMLGLGGVGCFSRKRRANRTSCNA